MVRPKKVRTVRFEPDVTYFKPQGVPLRTLEEVELTVDELEALRLSGIEGLNQDAAAEKMKVHQSTLQRMLSSAREKIADALVNGKAIKIHGGIYKMRGAGLGRGRGRGFGVGRGGSGRMGGPLAAGPGGLCRCPKCGREQAHVRGQPCAAMKCPECGSMMVRA